MSDEQRHENVRLEWERVRVTVQVVAAMIAGGFWNEAVSRSYYGMLYVARALLFSAGLEPRSHAGVIHLLSLHFARTGRLEAEQVRAFSQMQQAREDADYQSAVIFDEQAARDALERLTAFQDAATSALHADGFGADLQSAL